ncbi:MAG: sortase [Chloroflexota bacterium]
MKKIWSLIMFMAGIVVLGFAPQATSTADAYMGSSLSIPSIGLSAPIYGAPLAETTWDVSHLNMSVGHLQYLPWFGQPANVVLAGHSTTPEGQPDIFYALNAVSVGDEIVVVADGMVYRYIVATKTVVANDDLSILASTGNTMLTLFTCTHGSYNPTTGRYDQRTVVTAYPA